MGRCRIDRQLRLRPHLGRQLTNCCEDLRSLPPPPEMHPTRRKCTPGATSSASGTVISKMLRLRGTQNDLGISILALLSRGPCPQVLPLPPAQPRVPALVGIAVPPLPLKQPPTPRHRPPTGTPLNRRTRPSSTRPIPRHSSRRRTVPPSTSTSKRTPPPINPTARPPRSLRIPLNSSSSSSSLTAQVTPPIRTPSRVMPPLTVKHPPPLILSSLTTPSPTGSNSSTPVAAVAVAEAAAAVAAVTTPAEPAAAATASGPEAAAAETTPAILRPKPQRAITPLPLTPCPRPRAASTVASPSLPREARLGVSGRWVWAAAQEGPCQTPGGSGGGGEGLVAAVEAREGRPPGGGEAHRSAEVGRGCCSRPCTGKAPDLQATTATFVLR